MSKYQSWLRGMEHSADGQVQRSEWEVQARDGEMPEAGEWHEQNRTERHDLEEVEGEDAEGVDQIVVKGRVCAKGQAHRHRDQAIEQAKGDEEI